MKTSKLNNVKIKPIITQSHPVENIVGYKLFPEPYCNVAIIAKKKSGKTSVLYNCLQKCATKKTTVWLFSSTIHRDDTYKAMIEMLERKGCNVNTYTHFIDEDKNNILKEIIEELKQDGDRDESEPVEPIEDEREQIGGRKVVLKFNDEIDEIENEKKEMERYQRERKKERKKKLAPEHIFCFDDLGSDMRNKAINQLLKTNRHFKSKVFLIGHTLTDLEPASRKQLDYALIFKSFSEDKLLSLYRDLDLSIDFEKFIDAYNYATEKQYNFLYISCKTDELRKNFDEKIEW